MKVKTGDLYLASAIIAAGGVLTGAETSDSGSIQFEIEADAPLEDLELRFRTGLLQVTAITYRDCLTNLRELIYSKKNREASNAF